MIYILLAMTCLVLVLAVHIMWCRLTYQVKPQWKSLGVISLLGSGMYYFCSQIMFLQMYFSEGSVWLLPFKASAYVLFLFCIPVYFTSYLSMYLNSPTRQILINLGKYKAAPLHEIKQWVLNDDYVYSRLFELMEGGYVAFEHRKFYLLDKGRGMVMLSQCMQSILGRRLEE